MAGPSLTHMPRPPWVSSGSRLGALGWRSISVQETAGLVAEGRGTWGFTELLCRGTRAISTPTSLTKVSPVTRPSLLSARRGVPPSHRGGWGITYNWPRHGIEGSVNIDHGGKDEPCEVVTVLWLLERFLKIYSSKFKGISNCIKGKMLVKDLRRRLHVTHRPSA